MGCDVDSTHRHARCFDIRDAHSLTGDTRHSDVDVQPRGRCELVASWLQRLQAWLEEPGVPVVELQQQLNGAGLEVQAKLLQNQTPGQVSRPDLKLAV